MAKISIVKKNEFLVMFGDDFIYVDVAVRITEHVGAYAVEVLECPINPKSEVARFFVDLLTEDQMYIVHNIIKDKVLLDIGESAREYFYDGEIQQETTPTT